MGRLEILCGVMIISWLVGMILSTQLIDGNVSWGTLAIVGLIGVVASPLIGIWFVRAAPEVFEWENFGPRDFYLPAMLGASLTNAVVSGVVVGAMGV